MIALPAGTRIWLAAKVQATLEQDPFSGHVFVFRGRRGDTVKVLWWSSDGMCLFYKRLEQLQLKLDDLLMANASSHPASEIASGNATKPVRKPLPSNLPRVEQIYPPNADTCPYCGGTLKPLGADVAEQLEYVPASLRVIRHKRPKLACACCARWKRCG